MTSKTQLTLTRTAKCLLAKHVSTGEVGRGGFLCYSVLVVDCCLIQMLLHATLLHSFLIHTSWLCWLHRLFMGAGKAADVKARRYSFLCVLQHMYLWDLEWRIVKAGFSATETLLQHSAQSLPFMVIRCASQSAGDNLGHSCFPLTFKQWTFVLCRDRNLSSFFNTRKKWLGIQGKKTWRHRGTWSHPSRLKWNQLPCKNCIQVRQHQLTFAFLLNAGPQPESEWSTQTFAT